jgi:hypothetical protein
MLSCVANAKALFANVKKPFARCSVARFEHARGCEGEGAMSEHPAELIQRVADRCVSAVIDDRDIDSKVVLADIDTAAVGLLALRRRIEVGALSTTSSTPSTMPPKAFDRRAGMAEGDC